MEELFIMCILQEEATHIARKWTDLLKTAAIQAKIMAVDRATIMFILERGQDTMEVLRRVILAFPQIVNVIVVVVVMFQ